LRQAIEIDSVRYGLDMAMKAALLTEEQHRWGLLALCRSISAASNSTGHFAQYLSAKQSNIGRVLAKRRRSVVDEWSQALDESAPIGEPEWRVGNKVFSKDANDLLNDMSASEEWPAIIYADPPYTDDQYSRFYHIFESAILYDYSSISGKGEYRDGRFTSSFSLKTKVQSSIEKLIVSASNGPSALMISYPSNGLLENSKETILEMLRKNFEIVHSPVELHHEHSTMGGSKGSQKNAVIEYIFLAEGGVGPRSTIKTGDSSARVDSSKPLSSAGAVAIELDN
jgi:adenine-specific DNA-methyltransferase